MTLININDVQGELFVKINRIFTLILDTVLLLTVVISPLSAMAAYDPSYSTLCPVCGGTATSYEPKEVEIKLAVTSCVFCSEKHYHIGYTMKGAYECENCGYIEYYSDPYNVKCPYDLLVWL